MADTCIEVCRSLGGYAVLALGTAGLFFLALTVWVWVIDRTLRVLRLHREIVAFFFFRKRAAPGVFLAVPELCRVNTALVRFDTLPNNALHRQEREDLLREATSAARKASRQMRNGHATSTDG